MHPYHSHREHQASHRRVGTRLKDHPSGAMKHADGGAFSKITSKTAAADHDAKVDGKSSPKRYARGGKVKGNTTNIIIASQPKDQPMPAPMPMAGPPGPPPGGPPPGMPMRASGGRVGGESTKENINKMAARAKANSYFRGGAATGVGREEKAARMKRK